MVSRGVPAEKITIVSNGVHVDRFQPLEKNHTLAKELGVDGKTVIGFIGSFVQYEGLEYIVDAVELLVQKGKKDIVALMVGDGAVSVEVQQRVKDKGLDEYFIFTGRIPHEEVEGYYSLVDIAPLPRKGLPVCEMVSPLKPFEAMAMGKVVLSSNVAALAEIVQDGYNGMLFEKDNVQDLAEKIEILANDEELREKLGKQAREWVEKERDWKMLSQRLVNVYKGLLDG
jgi:glycosyltransferase involved in cell wall biosynthesis